MIKLKDYSLYHDYSIHNRETAMITKEYPNPNPALGEFQFGITWQDGDTSSIEKRNIIFID